MLRSLGRCVARMNPLLRPILMSMPTGGAEMDARVVTGGPDLEEIRTLLKEYAQWIAVDLAFQGFAQELAALPGDYVAPHGTLLLSMADGVSLGCIGVHTWQAKTCEMKRLYVRPRFQGRGCGRLLAERAIAWAVQAGY